MDPVIIVTGFVVLLTLLLYYMYKEKAGEPAPEKPVEPDVIKVRDYEAQQAAEKPAEEPEEPTQEPETPPAEQPQEPEPAEAAPTEPEVEAEPSKAEAEEPQPEPTEATPEETVTDDLDTLTGIGEKYRALLRAAGVNGIATLAGEEPDALLKRLKESNETEEIVKRLPRVDEVETWVEKAKQQGA